MKLEFEFPARTNRPARDIFDVAACAGSRLSQQKELIDNVA